MDSDNLSDASTVENVDDPTPSTSSSMESGPPSRKRPKSGTPLTEGQKQQFRDRIARANSNPPPIGYKDNVVKKKGTRVWEFFWIANNNKTAKCKACLTVLSKPDGSTSSLIKHVNKLHGIDCSSVAAATTTTEGSSSGNRLITAFTAPKINPKVKMEMELAEQAAKDNFTFSQIASRVNLLGLIARHPQTKVPTSPPAIKAAVMRCFEKVKKEYIETFGKMLKDNRRFSVTLDEATSMSNKKFFNVNLHANGGIVFNLGLIRVLEECGSEKCQELLRAKLGEFGLNIASDIVSVTSDGAAVMKKLGRLHEALHFLCLAHASQLAIGDTFYLKEKEAEEALAQIEAADNAEKEARKKRWEAAYRRQNNLTDEDPVPEFNDDDEAAEAVNLTFTDEEVRERDLLVDDIAEEDANTEEQELADLENGGNVVPILKGEVVKSVHKMRKIITFFRKSSIRADKLRRHLKADGKRINTLPRECKTRWNSLLNAAKRFVECRSQIETVLRELKRANLFPSPQEMALLEDLVEALEPMQEVIKTFSRQDLNIGEIDLITDYTLKKLNALELEKDNQFAGELFNAFKKRILERRQEDIYGLISMLQSPENYPPRGLAAHFTYPLVYKMRDIAAPLLKRLFLDRLDPPTAPGGVPEAAAADAGDSLTALLNKHREEVVKSRPSTGFLNRTSDMLEISLVLAQEIKNLSHDYRGRHLGNLYDALLTIQPTSVEAERAFSAMNIFVTKFRTCLDDKTVNALCFLREYFKKNEREQNSQKSAVVGPASVPK